MDIATLRRELEEHLKLNPHEQAPEGFRDRFDHWAEAYEAEDDESTKAELADLLQRVPQEAEAAAKAGGGDSAESAGAPTAGEESRPEPAPSKPRTRKAGRAAVGAADEEARPAPENRSGEGRWRVLAGIALAVAVAAFFAFR